MIAAQTKLLFIVDDACLQERISGRLNRYFLDKYIDRNMELTPTAKFNQSLIPVTIPTDLTLDQLIKIKRTDTCIVGIANDQGIEYKLTQFTTGSDLRGNQDYLNRMEFDKNFYDESTDEKSVKVGVIDSGYDFVAGPSINLIDATFMVGTDYVGGTNNPQDTLGHGTAVTALIAAKPATPTGFLGVASKASQVVPFRTIGNDGKMNTGQLFRAMKHAVNAGADVINISLGATAGVDPIRREVGMPISCDPVFGQSLFEAVDNNVFLVMSAGNATHTEIINGVEVDVPGSIFSPKDNSTENLFDYNFVPACWARYYKGVVAVASTNASGGIGDHSNWGADAVEMAAPGEDVLVAGLGGNYSKANGTSFAAPLVTGAVVNIIGYFKKRGWAYNPWMIEDTLINGTPTSPTLWGAGVAKKVRLGKSLNFKTLQNYLVSLNSKTDDERRQQPSDNPEVGQGLNRSLASVERRPIKLDVYTKEQFINVRNQSQIQAVIYYSDATTEVVSDSVQWRSADSANFTVTASGMAYPKTTGQFAVTAQLNGLIGTANVSVVDFSTWSGSRGILQELKVTNARVHEYGAYYQVYATYSDGRRRQVKDHTVIKTRTLRNGQTITPNYTPPTPDDEPFWVGGAQITDTILYRGIRYDYTYTMPKFTLKDAVIFKSATGYFGEKRETFLSDSTLTRDTSNFVGCFFDYDYEDPTLNPGEAWRNVQAVDGSARSGALTQVSIQKSFNIMTGITQGDLIALYYPIENSYMPTAQTPDDLVYSCQISHWGAGSLTKISLTRSFNVVDAKPVRIVFVKSLFRGYDPANKLDQLDLKSYLSDYPPTVAVAVLYDNGTVRVINTTAALSILSADGSTKPLNYTESYASAVKLYAFDARPGELLTLRATDALSGLTGDMKLSFNGDAPSAPPARQAVNVSVQGQLPAKQDSAYCAAHLQDRPFAGGVGSPADPFVICTAAQLVAVGKIIHEKTDGMYCVKNASIRLAANIDLASVSSNEFPIKLAGGCFTSSYVLDPVTNSYVENGVYHYFDGAGYSITGASFADAENTMGLFSIIQPNLWAVYTSNYIIKDLNISRIQGRGKEISLIAVGTGGAYARINNVHANDIYFEGNQVTGFGGPLTQINNSSITDLRIKTNPSNYGVTASALMASKEIKDSYADFEVMGAPNTNVTAVKGAAIVKSVYVKMNVRSGVQSSVSGFAGVWGYDGGFENLKLDVDINCPGCSFTAFTGTSQQSEYRDYSKPPDSVTVSQLQYGIVNVELTGNILLGSEFTGGTFAPIGILKVGRVSGLVVRATVNARRISGVAHEAVFATVANSDIQITANNVPAEAQVSRYFNERTCFKTSPVFTKLINTNVQITGFANPVDVYKDVNGAPAQSIGTIVPAGW